MVLQIQSYPYRELGMDYMSPFEVASGCDVVRTGKEYPDQAYFRRY